ncbi:tol-pal system-associated acyl-CoA thioesterase [Azospirillum sp. SYSU D00513]|uniref:tol-pal system-associated acyl-CoA thioesterase n=1 Tax=Azospirillum sp. SYSU D00513 TaxID=2812561 RepID=UPI001A95D045|nr:tol-pal system-associated acyl-CoA thioesterase [Azospirillum sp. SYSU D00513]
MTEAGASPDPLSGSFDGPGLHRYPLRVFYEDTDAGGIVYHANYLRFMERARTEMLRLLGLSHTDLMEREGVSFAVRRMRIEFVAPAKLDDTLEVVTRIADIGGASLAAAQSVRRAGPDGRELARADLTLALINRAGRPARLPAQVRDILNTLHPKA